MSSLAVPPLGPDPSTWPAGYRVLHADRSVDFQLNRWLAWATAATCDDLAEAATGAPGYPELTARLLQHADRLDRSGPARAVDAALLRRAAEFFLAPGDARRPGLRRAFVETLREAYRITPEETFEVPFGTGRLPGLRLRGAGRGSVVVHGGFDSYLEEFLPLLRAVQAAGYDVVGFEGPGQGGALEDHGLVLTPDWHHPVAAVLDALGLDDVTLVGISLGGCLAIRAAAAEPRVTRVVADDVLTDFAECTLRHLPTTARGAVRGLQAVRADRAIDELVRRRAARDPLAAWGVAQGCRVLGAGSPAGYLRRVADYTTGDVSGLVTADVLLLAGAEDHYVPVHQLGDQLATLTRARSVTARLFTRRESAQNHCQVGNLGLSVQVVLDWLAATAPRPGHRRR